MSTVDGFTATVAIVVFFFYAAVVANKYSATFFAIAETVTVFIITIIGQPYAAYITRVIIVNVIAMRFAFITVYLGTALITIKVVVLIDVKFTSQLSVTRFNVTLPVVVDIDAYMRHPCITFLILVDIVAEMVSIGIFMDSVLGSIAPRGAAANITNAIRSIAISFTFILHPYTAKVTLMVSVTIAMHIVIICNGTRGHLFTIITNSIFVLIRVYYVSARFYVALAIGI